MKQLYTDFYAKFDCTSTITSLRKDIRIILCTYTNTSVNWCKQVVSVSGIHTYIYVYIKWSVCIYIYMVHILTSTNHAVVKNYATRNSTAAFRGIDHSCETSEPGARPGGANHPMATHWIYFKGSHWWCILVMVHPISPMNISTTIHDLSWFLKTQICFK